MRWPAIDAMLIIAPPPRARMCGSTAWIPLNAPVRLTARTRSQSSAPISPIGRACAIDEDINASASLGYTLGQSGERAAIRDIERICRGMTVPAGNLGRDRLGRRRIAIENRNPRACSGEGAARRCADPVAAAGDESDFSGKILDHFFNPSLQLVEQYL